MVRWFSSWIIRFKRAINRSPRRSCATLDNETPEEYKPIPTAAQQLTCFILSYWATKMYLPVNIVRIDERTENIFFLAGEEQEIIIFKNGDWRYV
ncbi:DUF6888 family protein [Microcystis aeruginosa FBCC-A68]|uniref:DUF6888 family protein n=1 Tax=Microcystis aeruginosa TaxID=1126 RepID=UPI001115B6F5|nr:hypothetical protein [Microcystis aeruginosa]